LPITAGDLDLLTLELVYIIVTRGMDNLPVNYSGASATFLRRVMGKDALN